MRAVAVLGAFLLASWSAAAEPKLALTTEQAAPPADAAEPIRELLEGEAIVVSNDKGDVLARLWFRKEVPVRANAEQLKNGLTYREIPPTTVLGVVRFPRPFVDFRKQDIPAGVYTLRFAIQPETADHAGKTPHQEFLLLTPAAQDAKPELLEPKTLIERSSAVTGGTHPAVMLLFPGGAEAGGPQLRDRANGVQVVRFTRPAVADDGRTTLGFAVAIAGSFKE